MRWLCFSFLIAITTHFAGAATLTTRDGQIFQGDVHSIRDAAGHEKLVVVPSGGGFSLQYPLPDVAAISYRPPISGVLSGGTLLGDWMVRDVGDTGLAGSADYNQGIFSLSGEGASTDPRSDAFHFVYQRLAKEGELVVRLNSLSASDLHGMAGLMIRQSPDPQSWFAMADVTAAGQGEFRFRPNPTTDTTIQLASRIKPLCWLRLKIFQNVVVASQSVDGQKWEMVGRMALENIQHACIGMVLTSQKSDELATASFDRVRLKINGLRADYFATAQFTDLRLTRIDPEIDFNWGMGTPDVQIPASNFSVRWTGQLEPPSSDIYTFKLAAAPWAKLWLNGRLILDNRSPAPHNGKVRLEAQQHYDVRIDFGKDIRAGSCQLLWAIGDQPEEVVPTDAFVYRRGADELPDAATPQSQFVPLAKGILLVDGSFLPGSVTSIKGDITHFRYRNRSDMDLPLHQVARVVFQPLAGALSARMFDKSGMLTRQGDFIEGECQSLDQNELKLSSVVFGSSTYSVSTQAAAMVLRPPSPAATDWTIHTTSGAVLRASAFELDKDQATLTEPLIGKFSLTNAELIDISSSSNH